MTASDDKKSSGIFMMFGVNFMEEGLMFSLMESKKAKHAFIRKNLPTEGLLRLRVVDGERGAMINAERILMVQMGWNNLAEPFRRKKFETTK